MNDTDLPSFYYANKLGRIFLLALEEIIGRNGANAVFNQARINARINNFPPDNFDKQYPFSEISRIHKALEELYGLRGGRGLALRTGRACLKFSLREFGPMTGLTDQTFRLLPLTAKMRQASEALAQVFNKISDQQVTTVEDDDYFIWQVNCCAVCWERQTNAPACHLLVGLLQEAMYWVSCGKHFAVEETGCVARGDPACVIQIDKRPME